ncbi:MAG TPA: co-chaperone DjlA [Steroidobacteraceae bacterium]|nr:co-chaperone DjlA [Steroidobacteraceae bacterium]
MKWIGKVTGGLLGGLVLGPIGAALGVLLGHQVDEMGAEQSLPPPADLAPIGTRFFRASFQVMGYLAKADGRVSEREIAAARALMQELRLDVTQVREAIACFTAGKQPDYDYGAEIEQLRQICHGRPELARVFVEIQMRAALEGNDLEPPVRALLGRLAAALRVSTLELMHIETVLRIQRAGGFRAAAAPGAATAVRERELTEAYRVLETDAAASDEQVAKAYRRLLQRHHPDKLKANGLPESMLAHAQRRTQQIIEAWEIVRQRRGIR